MKQFNEVENKVETTTVQFELPNHLMNVLNQVADCTGLSQDALLTLGVQGVLTDQVERIKTLGGSIGTLSGDGSRSILIRELS
jgi:hypothetical protein